MNEAYIIDALKTRYPELDLRIGTALRDLLVRPSAYIYDKMTTDVDKLASLLTLNQDMLSDYSADEINDLFALYGVKYRSASYATGTLEVVVPVDRTYEFTTSIVLESGGKTYNVAQDVVITDLTPVNGGYAFYLDIVASEPGPDSNLPVGTAFTFEDNFVNASSVTASTDISGGSTAVSLDSMIAELKAKLVAASPKSRTSIRAFILDIADNLLDCGVSGVFDSNRVRTRDNIYGLPSGGNTEVYIKQPCVRTSYILRGTKVDNNYRVVIPNYVIEQGFLAVSGITDTGNTTTGNYDYTLEISKTTSNHDIYDSPEEYDKTVYRTATLYINADYDDPVRDFSVILYMYSNQKVIQDAIDSETYSDDILVRVPYLVQCSLKSKLRIEPGSEFNASNAKQDIKNYIDGLNFGKYPDRSNIISILRSNGAAFVDSTANGTLLSGVIKTADDDSKVVGGDTLDLDKSELANYAYINNYSSTFIIETPAIQFTYL